MALSNFGYIIIISFSLFLSSPSFAVKYNSALESSPEDIIPVRTKLLQARSPYHVDGSTQGKVLIAVNIPIHSDQPLETIPQEWGLKGKLPHSIIETLNGLKEEYIRNISSSITGNIKNTEFIFTGHKENGLIALTLSLLWFEEYKKLTHEEPSPNQIKSLLFASSIKGDNEFKKFANKRLVQSNILNFLPYFTTSPLCGIPIYFLPDEQIFDIMYQHKGTFLKGGGLLGSYFLSQCFYKRPLWDYLPVPPEVSLPFLAVLIFKKIQDYKYFPSENIVIKAFEYTQENYHSADEAPLNKIGMPPVLSSRRGVGAWLRWFIIGA